MGNCCKTASSLEWGGEDWGPLVPEERKKVKNTNRKKSSGKVFDLISASNSSVSSSLDDHGNGRIKIKMTKREFEVLLEEIEKQKQIKQNQKQKQIEQNQKQKQKQQGKVLSAEAVLERLLMKVREDHHKPWSPVLESISEV